MVKTERKMLKQKSGKDITEMAKTTEQLATELIDVKTALQELDPDEETILPGSTIAPEAQPKSNSVMWAQPEDSEQDNEFCLGKNLGSGSGSVWERVRKRFLR